jgi:hypothetical protein
MRLDAPLGALVLALATVVAPAVAGPGPAADLEPTRTAEAPPEAADLAAEIEQAAASTEDPRARVLDTARTAVEAYPAGEDGLGEAAEPMLDSARANLDATEALLAVAEDGDRSELERSVEATVEMTRWQTASVGGPGLAEVDPPTVEHERPSDALEALAAETGTTLSADQRATLAELDDLPAPVADALTELVDAQLATMAATETAIPLLVDAPDLDGWRDAQRPLVEHDALAAEAVAELLAARVQVLEATVELDRALDVASASQVQDAPAVQAVPGFSVDLSSTDDTYEEDVALLVDGAGDDEYRNNAGGSGVDVGCFEPIPDPEDDVALPERTPRAAAAVDLGGSDRYVSERDCGVNGGGHWGAGLLVDDGGSDVYRAGDQGTNGGAQGGGVGLLVDSVGDDVYEAGDDGVNGGADGANPSPPSQGTSTGQGGVALLVDGAGDDTYDAGESGTNGGGWGFDVPIVGALADLGGSDAYDAGHFSTNGGGWLGQGFLFDAAGDDEYRAGDDFGTIGVNGGAQLGVGFLYDDSGDDTYAIRDHGTFLGSENGGAAGGVALLLDADGRDGYHAASGGTNGGITGGLGGLGVLADGAGDDVYEAGGSGANGGSSALLGALGLLADHAGDDEYLAEGETSNGAAALGTGTALLFDRSGEDRYRDGLVDCTDCTVVPKGVAGAQVDG